MITDINNQLLANRSSSIAKKHHIQTRNLEILDTGHNRITARIHEACATHHYGRSLHRAPVATTDAISKLVERLYINAEQEYCTVLKHGIEVIYEASTDDIFAKNHVLYERRNHTGMVYKFSR